MVERRLTAWLRSALALFGIAGILLLAGCGGGSGAPNNPYTPPPPVIPPLRCCPRTLTVYPGTPATLTISGGVPPTARSPPTPAYCPSPAIVSGDTIVLAANQRHCATTVVAITVQDSAATVSAPATISVQPGAAPGERHHDHGQPEPGVRRRRRPPLLRRHRHGDGEGHRQRRRRHRGPAGEIRRRAGHRSRSCRPTRRSRSSRR